VLSKERFIVIRHYLDEGLPKAAIARKLGINRRTVQRLAQSGKQEPSYGPRPARGSQLDPYTAYLRERLTLYPELTGVRLLAELRDRGYAGGYTVLKDYLRTQRPVAPFSLEQRFEVEPGEQAQVDFAVFKTSFGTIYALLVVLSWSRALWVRFSFQQDQLTVLAGLHQAFVSFGGVPRTLLFDRMKTAVIGATPTGAAIFNPELLRFAAHYGCKPRACRPYRAKTKGRVERAVSYLRQSFFYGRAFTDLAHINAECGIWLADVANARVHGTTAEAPSARLQRERQQLLPLPADAYVPFISLGRRISRDGFVSYNGNGYSVPDGLEHVEVQVRATLTTISILQGDQLVAVHPLLTGRGQRRLDPHHQRGGRPRAEQPARDYAQLLPEIAVEQRPLSVYEQVLA
jgi:transposase